MDCVRRWWVGCFLYSRIVGKKDAPKDKMESNEDETRADICQETRVANTTLQDTAVSVQQSFTAFRRVSRSMLSPTQGCKCFETRGELTAGSEATAVSTVALETARC